MEDEVIIALDLGTSRTVAMAAEINPGTKRLTLLGYAETATQGVHKGLVDNVEYAKNSIERAIKSACDNAKVNAHSVITSISGDHIESCLNKGQISINSRTHEITRDDIEMIRESAKEISLPDDRQSIHTMNCGYELDGHTVTASPEGLRGQQLLLNMLIIHGSTDAIENRREAIKKASLDVEGTAISGLCAALAVLGTEEKRSGVVVVDIGGGAIDYLVYVGGYIMKAGSIAIGGEHINNDICQAFNLDGKTAEELKIQFGGAQIDPTVGLQRTQIKTTFGGSSRSISIKNIQVVMSARVEEMLRLVRKELDDAGCLALLNAGVVFTGGGAEITGIVELGEKVFGCPCKIGTLQGIYGIEKLPNKPSFATAIGLLKYGANSVTRKPRNILERIFGGNGR